MTLKVGDTRTTRVTITDEKVRQFAEMSGDFNPVHMDEEYAKNTRFKNRIAHGMISGAIISKTLVDLGVGGIYLSQNLKFLQPIFLDETIEAIVTVTGLRAERGIATVETVVKKVPGGELCVKGEALIMLGEFI